jgi:ribosome maturation factor RimP
MKLENQDPVIQEIQRLAEALLQHEQMELVDVQFRRESTGWVLRILIDKTGGVLLDDCSAISRQMSDLLDVKNIIHHPYNLEVSSPGLNRPLRKEADFKRHIGERVTIKTSCLIDNRKTFKGKLAGYRDGVVGVAVEGKEYSISVDDIEKANLDIPL